MSPNDIAREAALHAAGNAALVSALGLCEGCCEEPAGCVCDEMCPMFCGGTRATCRCDHTPEDDLPEPDREDDDGGCWADEEEES